MNNSFTTFLNSITANAQSKKYILAVSGGIDSMAMLYLFKESKLDFAVANVNFNLRGEESDGDSLFIKQYCSENNIKFYGASFDTNNFAKENKISTQMAARDLRYKWFEELLNKHNYNKIAIAHHLDDQAETFFINIIRGTGIAGMHGINLNKDNIIRPLMFTDRKAITEFIKAKNIPYREDSSNASDKYQRNYIRHNILNEFINLREDFSKSLNQSIQQVKQVEDYAQFHINNEIKNICKFNSQSIIEIDQNKLMQSYSPNLILYNCIKEYGFKESHINDILKLINEQKPGSLVQSAEFEILIDREKLLLNKKAEKANTDIISINSFEDKKWDELNISLDINYKGNYKVSNPNLAFIDANKVSFPIIIRNWKAGDFFYPFGMNKKKKLSNFFIDNKISRIEKQNIKLLCSNNSILWIIGYRNDNRFAVDKNTKQIIKIEYNGNS